MDAILLVQNTDRLNRYPVLLATWNAYLDRADVPTFCIHVEAGRNVEGSEFHDEPWWQVNLVQQGLTLAQLKPGAQFSVPDGYDPLLGGYVTNFLNVSVHQQSDRNTIRILDADDDRLRIHLTGETIEGTYHEETGTRHTYSTLTVATWFTRDLEQGRSFA